MIPPVIPEQDCRAFKFWFNGKIREGMCYRNKLFYRLQTVATSHRPKLYQQACQFAQHDAVVVTISDSDQACSLWLSLHSVKLPQLVEGESSAGHQTSLGSMPGNAVF